jgi:hypothetical protein
MPEVTYFLLKKLALLRIELSAGFSEPLQHLPQVQQMCLERAANLNRVVQLYETLLVRPLKTARTCSCFTLGRITSVTDSWCARGDPFVSF